MKNPRSFVLAVAGGSGSGKSAVVRGLLASLQGVPASLLDQDSYYLTMGGGPGNFDAPEAIDHALLSTHVERLAAGEAVAKPQYDFATHQRTSATLTVTPARLLVVEGLFAYWDERVRRLCDLCVYIDADADLRFIRRLQRDVAERGRTLESVVSQYVETVRPMHERYSGQMRQAAHAVILNNSSLDESVRQLNQELRSRLSR
jgi:uridine kinase